jgi:prophage regulatory protein
MFNSALGGVNMVNIILRLPTVKLRTGLSRSSIYLRISKGEFPSSISLGGRAVGWLEADVNDWLELKIAARKTGRG